MNTYNTYICAYRHTPHSKRVPARPININSITYNTHKYIRVYTYIYIHVYTYRIMSDELQLYVDRIVRSMQPSIELLAEECHSNPCEKWTTCFPDKAVPARHWHCRDKCCPTFHAIGNGKIFSASAYSHMLRHLDAHERQNRITNERTCDILRYVLTNASNSNRKVREQHMSGFRLKKIEEDTMNGSGNFLHILVIIHTGAADY